MEESNPKRIRRVRYKGTHPKAFGEKYKELKPEQYREDMSTVLSGFTD